jgi:hypothetical protein
VSDHRDLFEASFFFDIVNKGWNVILALFGKAVIPKSSIFNVIKGFVVQAVLVASCIPKPDIVATIGS